MPGQFQGVSRAGVTKNEDVAPAKEATFLTTKAPKNHLQEEMPAASWNHGKAGDRLYGALVSFRLKSGEIVRRDAYIKINILESLEWFVG